MREQDRFELFEFVRAQWGPDRAGDLMELLPPVDRDELVTKADLAELRGDLLEKLNEQTRTILLALVPMWLTAVGLAVAIASIIGR